MKFDPSKNVARMLSSIQKVQDKFDRIIFMEDQMSVAFPGGTWYPIRESAENARETVLPKLVIMNSHLKMFEKYWDLQRR